jgi:glycerol-3-phosphate O-acyltransferase/dihydroxyacetone phosphate acyltransferase
MLYSFAKMLMTAGLRFFYRHIHVTGFENVPSKGPVILIANHNASLMDAALLGIMLKRKAYFFARGDVFVNRPIQKILWWLHMMPVHSHQGGRNTLSVNTDSFSDGKKILSNGGIIVFFPESSSHIEHQLLPFRKGVFRLAFDSAAAGHFSFDIPIVPVGITYDHPVDCRTDVQVHAGKPILLSNYINEYRRNAAAALLHICKDAHQSIHELVLHIKDKSRLQMANQYIITSRNDNPVASSAWKIASTQKLGRERNICAVINNTSQVDFENKKQRADAYFTLLSGAGLKDKTATTSFSFPAWKKIMMWMGFPFYLTGLLLNGLPVLIARQIADKKVYREDFYSWIFVVCYSFGYFFWLMAIVATIFLSGWLYAAVVVVVMIITGLFAYVYKDWLHDNRQQKKWQLLTAAAKNELSVMRETLHQAV